MESRSDVGFWGPMRSDVDIYGPMRSDAVISITLIFVARMVRI